MKIKNNTLAFFILTLAFCSCKQKAIPEIKRIIPKQIRQADYQEYQEYIDCQKFDIQADEVIYENGKIKALNDYAWKDKKVLDSQVLLVWEQGQLKQEIRTSFFWKGRVEIDTLNYKEVAPDTLRSIEGRHYPATDLILDSLHRIVGRIQYRNDVGGFVDDYCRFTRDAKGNKKEAVGVYGEVGQEGYKGIYDYLAFDAYGNWTKRRVRREYQSYDSDELYPFYEGKKKEAFLSFPVKLSAKPYEYIEERVIEYKEEGNWWDFILAIASSACKQEISSDIKVIRANGINYPEFDIHADVIIYENGKIKALNGYRGIDKQEISEQVLLVWEQGLLKQEIRKNFISREKIYIDTLKYKQVAPDTLRTTAKGIDIVLDSLHRIVGRILYDNYAGGLIENYYRFTRDAKGNKKEAIYILGVVDNPFGEKRLYDYLAFDAQGNWTKRRVRRELQHYGFFELRAFYAGKKKIPFLSFPVKLSANPDESIEERVIEYKEGNWWDFIF